MKGTKMICTLGDCERPHEARGYCATHYQRLRRHGDPLVVLSGVGANSPAWKGDDVTYPSAHRRVYRAKGKASEHPCIDCGGAAREWSYSGLDPLALTGTANDGRGKPIIVMYSTNPDHYEPRCKSCHNVFDISRA